MREDLAADQNTYSQKFYRIINEVPTILMIGIVILVVVKPFSSVNLVNESGVSDACETCIDFLY